MQAIKMRGSPHPTLGEAQDGLAGVRTIPGFLFGYVDEKQNRVISFHADTHPSSPVVKGQERVTVAFMEPNTIHAEINKAIAGIRAMA